MIVGTQSRPDHKPLYQQVRELLVARIAAGEWLPATPLPSEQALAEELGVSQGTVRKSLDSLVNANLLERRQGKGTFVAEHTSESAIFRFYRLNRASGERVTPKCRQSIIEYRTASPAEAHALELSKNNSIFSVTRVRLDDDQPVSHEVIIVPATIFPDLDKHQPLPNTLYTLYQGSYDVSVASATEKLTAVELDKRLARELGQEPGSAALQVERIALDITKRPVEYRTSTFVTHSHHYQIDLG